MVLIKGQMFLLEEQEKEVCSIEQTSFLLRYEDQTYIRMTQ